MSGKVGDLSPKQEAALKQIRENIKDLDKDYDDQYLLRWLRARCFDLKKSEKMLRDSLEWRKKAGADTVVNWEPPEVLVKYHPGGHYGFDKNGFPIWIDMYGYADLQGLMYSARKSELIKYKMYAIEKLYKVMGEQATKLDKRVDGVAMIFDMEGIGTKHLWKPVVSIFCDILSMFEANYPETLQYCFVINAPRIFPIAYNLVKPFLSEDTKKKIHVLGGGWKHHLQEYIDPDQLPVHWGGTCTDPDGEPHCKSRVNIGGEIPTKYYMERPADVDTTNFSSITVCRRSSSQLDFEITHPGSVLNWQFWTKDNDIGFGVFRRTCSERQKAGDMIEVVPSERVNSHMVPEHGSITCEVPDVVRFDNTYSLMWAKRVSYLIEVLQPDEMDDLDVENSSSFHSCSELQELAENTSD